VVASQSRRRIDPDPGFRRSFGERAKDLPGAASQELARLRAERLERFMELGVPTRRDEAWRFCDVARHVSRPAGPAAAVELPLERVLPHLLGGPKARRLVFVNGRLQPQWSHVGGLPDGGRIESLARAAEARPEAVAAALAGADGGRSFTALNAAFADCGAWVELGPGVELADPVQLLLVTVGDAAPGMIQPRIRIRLDDGAALDLIECHVGLGPGPVLTNLVLEAELGAGARLTHDRLQHLAEGAALVGRVEARLGPEARYRQTTVVAGGALVRNESEIRIQGSGVECLLAGIAMPRGREQVDTLVRMHHEAPGSHSDQSFRSIVDDRAHSAFAGKILVHPGAQETNAYQKSDNLLLSEEGEVDTKPELEIYADDVKCSHGATCGELDPTALFYLRARGLAPESARALLTWAFAAELVERLAEPSAREAARRVLAARLPSGAVPLEEAA
jgi:Fe-S cluster assembly protein SufD